MWRLLLIMYLFFLNVQIMYAQKSILGRSTPVQFSLFVASEEPRKIVTLKENYLPVIDVVNIDSLPPAVSIRPYSVAVVIGVEQYNFIPSASYAARDAALMARYFKVLLGVDRVILHTNSEVSGFFFDNLFDAEDGELFKAVVKGETDLFVYYSGHGMPSASGEDLFMLPVDCKMKLVEKQGFSLNRLLSQLALLPTKSTTVFIDACFSGFGKFSYADRPVSLTPTKGVKVRPLVNQPWLDNPQFRVFTSSSSNQASLILDEARTSLFTYFLASGLRGEADQDSNGMITAAELYQYLKFHVTAVSKKIYQEQTPCFYGDDKLIFVRE